jgi:hypothetical protein
MVTVCFQQSQVSSDRAWPLLALITTSARRALLLSEYL